MATTTETPRTDLELQAIVSALMLCDGVAPKWLNEELAAEFQAVEAAKPDPNAYRGHMSAALSFGGLLVAFLGCADLVGDITFAPAKIAVRAAAVDPDGLEAIALVQDWQAAGDEKPVLQRLAGAVRNPAYPRAWSAERTEDDSYLVIFREPAGTPAYAFEVNLESESVQATPEAVERLTMLRVREVTESTDNLVARAR
ncbi:MAG: hypothetical protein ABL955_00305 [Elusimicrobiota bacterium]